MFPMMKQKNSTKSKLKYGLLIFATLVAVEVKANHKICDWILRIPPPIKKNSEISTDECYNSAKNFLKSSKVNGQQTTGNVDLYLDWSKNLSDHGSCRMFFKNLKAATSRYPVEQIDDFAEMASLFKDDPDQSLDLIYLSYDTCRSLKKDKVPNTVAPVQEQKPGIK